MPRKVSDHEHAFGLSLRQESDRQFSKMLLFGSILVFTHLLGISPSEVDAVGLKITVPDISILYGALSILFLHFLFRAMSYSQRGEYFLRLALNKPEIRSALLMSKKIRKGKSSIDVKKSARSDIAFYNAIMTPYYLAISIIIISAFFTSIVDLFYFGDYLMDNSALIKGFLADYL